MWQDSYAKYMYQVGATFKIMQDGEHVLLGYMKASGHLIFDINMDFAQKAQWVKNDHLTPDIEDSKYAGLVFRDSVIIALNYTYLHQT